VVAEADADAAADNEDRHTDNHDDGIANVLDCDGYRCRTCRTPFPADADDVLRCHIADDDDSTLNTETLLSNHTRIANESNEMTVAVVVVLLLLDSSSSGLQFLS